MILDADHAAFVQTGVAIEIASRDAHNVPSVARAVAARVAPDRSRLTLFVPRAFGVRCLNAVAVTGAVAAAFCRPTTIQTIQLKGSDAVLTPVTPDDLPHVRAMIAAFVSELRAIGHSTDLALLDVTHDPADLVGVTFSPDAAFVQTPGPAAGARL